MRMRNVLAASLFLCSGSLASADGIHSGVDLLSNVYFAQDNSKMCEEVGFGQPAATLLVEHAEKFVAGRWPDRAKELMAKGETKAQALRAKFLAEAPYMTAKKSERTNETISAGRSGALTLTRDSDAYKAKAERCSVIFYAILAGAVGVEFIILSGDLTPE